MKEIISAFASALTFIAYIPYVRDIIKGKTHPHAYSWLVWGFTTIIIFALQLSNKAGAGAYVSLASGVSLLIVFLLGLRYGKRDITASDTVFFILALAATAVWVFAQQPVLSIILLMVVEMLGFMPTLRKSWDKPYSETLSHYQIAIFRQALTILALQSYMIVTFLCPATWVFANTFFVIMLVFRRQQLTI